MNVLVDTNIILDVWLRRGDLFHDSAIMMTLVEEGLVKGCLCATTLTTLFYVARRELGAAATLTQISSLMKFFDVAPVGRAVAIDALALRFEDFEDAVLHEAARHAGCDAIVTRNVEDFAQGTLPVYAPEQFIAMTKMSLHEKAPRRYR